MKKYLKYRYVYIALAILCVFIALRIALALLLRTPIGEKIATNHLEKIFPLLATMQVTNVRTSDWCHSIAYARGTFGESSHPTTCYLFEQTPKTFDGTAQADFHRIVSSINHLGLSLQYANITLSGSTITGAQFYIDNLCLGIVCNSKAFVYAPHYQTLPPDEPHNTWYWRIDDNWYKQEEDWM